MGATADAAGNMVWTFHVPLDEQIAYYKAHPPSALAGLTCTPVDLSGHRFDGHGEPVNAVFAVACRCGSRLFALLGEVDEDQEIGPPLALACHADDCEEQYDIFDPSVHGHDAVAGGAGTPDDDTYPDQFPEPRPPYEVLVRFEFGSEVLGGDAQWKGKEPEIFTWITVLARLPSGELYTLSDEECA